MDAMATLEKERYEARQVARQSAEIFSSIRKQARRVKHKRSHFTAEQHMDAIIALANIGSERIRKLWKK